MRYIALQVLLVLLLLGGEDCTALLGGERQLNSNSEKQQEQQEQIDKTAGDLNIARIANAVPVTLYSKVTM